MIEASPSAATFRLRWSEATWAVYPFEFELDVRFSLEDARLCLSADVKNLAAETDMPASFGFHPALRWPLPFGQPRSEHAITFDQDEPAPVRRIDADGLVASQVHPTPVVARTLALRDDLFATDVLIFDQLASRCVRYGARAGPQIEISFQDTEILGVWTKPGAGYVCIEPWHGMADPADSDADFWRKPAIFSVAPGQARRCEMAIAFID